MSSGSGSGGGSGSGSGSGIDPSGGTLPNVAGQQGYDHEVTPDSSDSGSQTINWSCDICGTTGQQRTGGQKTWDEMHNEGFQHVQGQHSGSPSNSFHVLS